MLIRPLDPIKDRALVDALFRAAADYIRVERGTDPDAGVTDEFFTDAPPGCDPATSYRAGLFCADGGLTGLADLAFGFPAPGDAFLGLMVLAKAARGQGAGSRFLAHLERTARDRGARHLYLAVLDANPRGRAFWERAGFRVTHPNRTVTLGGKVQLAHRMGKDL